MNDFTSLPLAPPLQQALETLEYRVPTAVQAQALPALLDGRDLIAQAPTGSGKTVAFGLALLQRIDPALIRAQALVLCPTRELAIQVAESATEYGTIRTIGERAGAMLHLAQVGGEHAVAR